MTKVRVEARSCKKGRRKNDTFALSDTLLTIIIKLAERFKFKFDLLFVAKMQ